MLARPKIAYPCGRAASRRRPPPSLAELVPVRRVTVASNSECREGQWEEARRYGMGWEWAYCPAQIPGDWYADERFHDPNRGYAGNADNHVNISDAVYLLSYLFREGPPPVSLPVGDVDGSGAIDIGDAVYLINYIFRDGPAPIGGN